jgi:hypothetical protein
MHHLRGLRSNLISLCHYGLADMTAEHILQDCPQHTNELQKKTWPTYVDLREKLYRVTSPLKEKLALLKNLVYQSKW